jgi:prepilin-type N-terminal cleavage/methylation domain-containing protein
VPNGLRGTAGYTLVELAVVVVLLGIMSLVSYVRLGPTFERGKVNGAASVLAGDLAYSQMIAAKSRKPVVVILTVATQQYIVRDRADASRVYRTRYLGSGTEYALNLMSCSGCSPASPPSLEVFPTGVSRATATFTLGLNGYTRQVKFTKAGQVRVIGGV